MTARADRALRRVARWLSVVALAWPFAAGEVLASEPSAVEERHYLVELDGHPAGSVIERESRSTDRITSDLEMTLTLRRGDLEIELETVTRFVETLAHEPVSMSLRQVTGATVVEVAWTFSPRGVEARSIVGAGPATVKSEPLPAGPWLTPAAAAREMTRQVAARAPSFRFLTLDPSLGLEPVAVEMERLGDGSTLRVGERDIPTTRWRERMAGIESIVWLDAEAEVVRSEVEILGLPMALVLTDPEGAAAPRKAPELLARTLIRPDRAIEAPRATKTAIYRVRARSKELADLPSAAGQQATREGPQAFLVRVSADLPPLGPTLADSAPFLVSSTYLDHAHPRLRELLLQALDGQAETTPTERAEILRAFVHRYLQRYDLATAFVPASVVAEQKSGDCTESAVLLAALLRGAGIPSRVVDGLLYVEEFAGEREIFGYHMWTQAFVDGRWVDYDAITEGRFDATHIALGNSALDQPQGVSAASELGSAGHAPLEIEVISVERHPARMGAEVEP
ncbi:MAG TPA: transglutaminase-like domain-containing protein [Thermoanaerobaculia bacterium]|nr:transglutaminase-like domain-containing protein [Thermoanaerobaculia bacterium]